MREYGSSTYGDTWADDYDDWAQVRIDEAQTRAAADRLADLAGGGSVLELAIGTGRIALPLAERGLAVTGIDASEAMVAKLRDKPGGADIPVTIGDFADVAVEGTFDLAIVVFNTIFALATQDDQVRCFANVADHLGADGVFVIEAFVPDVARFDRGQRVSAARVERDLVSLEVSSHDPVGQTIDTQVLTIDGRGTRMRPVHLRYAWPAELDLMARLAGLELRERWAGWDRSAFTAASGAHVSVYGRAGG